MLTTHRIIWFREVEGLEIPLFHVKDFSKGVRKTLLFKSIMKMFGVHRKLSWDSGVNISKYSSKI